jgi:hypothetical protein
LDRKSTLSHRGWLIGGGIDFASSASANSLSGNNASIRLIMKMPKFSLISLSYHFTFKHWFLLRGMPDTVYQAFR